MYKNTIYMYVIVQYVNYVVSLMYSDITLKFLSAFGKLIKVTIVL